MSAGSLSIGSVSGETWPLTGGPSLPKSACAASESIGNAGSAESATSLTVFSDAWLAGLSSCRTAGPVQLCSLPCAGKVETLGSTGNSPAVLQAAGLLSNGCSVAGSSVGLTASLSVPPALLFWAGWTSALMSSSLSAGSGALSIAGVAPPAACPSLTGRLASDGRAAARVSSKSLLALITYHIWYDSPVSKEHSVVKVELNAEWRWFFLLDTKLVYRATLCCITAF